MSVAFRRESDEEHKEPRFELPIPPGPNLVTERGYPLISAQVSKLESDLRAAVSDQREMLMRDLRYWRRRLTTAQLAPRTTGDVVAIGTRVTLEQGGKTRVLEIVGHDEAEPVSGRIAWSAPLAQELLGAEPGEQIASRGGRHPMMVLSIEAIE